VGESGKQRRRASRRLDSLPGWGCDALQGNGTDLVQPSFDTEKKETWARRR